jgi:hypothetical protein
VHGNQNIACANLPFVLLGLEFRNAKSDEGANEATGCTAYRGTAKRAHDRAGRYERSNARNCQRANARQ